MLIMNRTGVQDPYLVKNIVDSSFGLDGELVLIDLSIETIGDGNSPLAYALEVLQEDPESIIIFYYSNSKDIKSRSKEHKMPVNGIRVGYIEERPTSKNIIELFKQLKMKHP